MVEEVSVEEQLVEEVMMEEELVEEELVEVGERGRHPTSRDDVSETNGL